MPSMLPCEPSVLEQSSEDLGEKLKRLIAEHLQVSPSEVTPEFIHHFREQNMYREMKVDFSNRYGGFNPPAETYLTEKEIDDLRGEIDQYLKSLEE